MDHIAHFCLTPFSTHGALRLEEGILCGVRQSGGIIEFDHEHLTAGYRLDGVGTELLHDM